MANKTLTLFSLGILTLLVLTSFASAEITFSNVPTLSRTGNSFSINVTSNTSETVNFAATTITDSDGKNITFTPLSSVAFNSNTLTITMSYSIDAGFDFFEEIYSTTLTADGTSSLEKNQTLSFEEMTFCSYDGNSFDLEDHLDSMYDIEITNNGFGDEENWYPFDEIEVAVTVKATDSKVDVEDITLEWGLYDKESREWVIKVDDEDEFDLDGGDKEVVTFTFKLDDDMDMDLDELDNSNLVLYVRVNGKADSDYESIDGKNLCSSDSFDDFDFTLDKFVLVDNVQITGTTSCGKEVQITADVWNIGGSKQKDVSVLISNKELGINKKVEIGDIKSFDSEELSTTITLPNDADEKQYTLTFYVYDDDGELYEVGKDDDESIFYSSVTLSDCSTTPTASVSASLDSDAKAGQQLIVKATVTNTGSATKTFALSASSYADWASSATLDKNSLTLEAGRSAEVVITLEVLKDAQGENGFDIEVVDGSKFLSQPVSVSIEKSSFEFDITGWVTGFGNNAYLYAIGALNLVLIAGIIFVAVRIARKRKQE